MTAAAERREAGIAPRASWRAKVLAIALVAAGFAALSDPQQQLARWREFQHGVVAHPVAEDPQIAVTVALDGEVGAKEKSWPTPVSATVCGVALPLSTTVKVPLVVPLVVGSKKTPIEQLLPG